MPCYGLSDRGLFGAPCFFTNFVGYAKISRAIKKLAKILWIVIVLSGAAIALSLMAMQTPKVQTRMAARLLERFSMNIDGEISFSSIHVYPFRTVVIRDLLIKDAHPYTGRDGNCQDTLAFAAYISANVFNLRSIFDKEGLHLSNITVVDGGMNLVIEPWENAPKTKRDNLCRVFNLQKDKYELVDGEWRIRQKEDKEGGNVFDAARVNVENFRFTLRSHVKERVYPEGCINWSDMDVSDIHIRGHKMAFRGKVMSAVADEVWFKEKSGYACEHVSGSVSVGRGKAAIEDIKIRDQWSRLGLESLVFSYETERAWKYFPEQIRLDAVIEQSSLSLRSLGYFSRAFNGMTEMMEIKGRVGGYVNDFSTYGLSLEFPELGVYALLDGSVIGMPKSPAKMADITTTLSFTTSGLERLIKDKAPAAGLSISQYAPGKRIKFSGKLSGPFRKLKISGGISSSIGSLIAGLTLRTPEDGPMAVSGKIASTDLDIGLILGADMVHECTMRTAFSATLGRGKSSLHIDSLFVSRLNLLGYDYTGIAAAGEYRDNSYNGKLICNDPNLNFLFQGIITPSTHTDNAAYNFYANLGYADLHALHIDKREVSRMSGLVHANFVKVKGDDVLGDIEVQNLQLQDSRGMHGVGDIAISSHMNDDINRIHFDSGFMEASYVGSSTLGNFIKDLNARALGAELSSLVQGEIESEAGNYYDIDISMHDSQDVLSFFMPGLYIADSTSFKLSMRRNGALDGRLESRRIAHGKKYLKELSLDIDSMDEMLLTTLWAGEFNWPPINTLDNNLILTVRDNNIGVGFSYGGGDSGKGELYMTAELSRTEGDSLKLLASLLPSYFSFGEDAWEMAEAKVDVSGSGVRVSGFDLRNGNQRLSLDGGWSGKQVDTLRLALDSVNISVLNYILNSNTGISGLLNGQGTLISAGPAGKAISMGLQSENASIAGKDAGTIDITGKWDNEANGFRFSLSNDILGRRTLMAGGLYRPEGRDLNLRVRLDSLDLGYATPLLSSVFSEMGGSISGEFRAKGPLDSLELGSSDGHLNEAMLRVAYTGVSYTANGPFSLNSSGFSLSSDPGVEVRDRYGHTGLLTGGVEWDRLRDMKVDLHAEIDGMEALNTAAEDNPSFYGHVFARGRVDITGPLKAVFIDVGASTASEGQLHVPLAGSALASQSDLLSFTQVEETQWLDPYELMMQTQEKEEKSVGDLRVKLNLNVNQDTQAFIDMDSSGGNALNGRGSGQIEIEVRPARETFTINGNYGINTGNFHFSVLDLVSRDFEIEDGSTIHFNGDIVDSDLDIKAVYKTRASVATLISDTTSTASRRQVECGINISGKLSNPQLSFSIEIPDLDPTTQGRVQSALNSDDKVQKQFLALLVSNGFLPDESSGIVNNSSLLVSNVTEVMAGQLNNILQKLDIPLDLGLDYEQSSSGTSAFDVAISTELFNSRVIVNGSIGNREYSSSTSGGEVVGDIDIEIKLNSSGNLRLMLFSHSADQYTNYLDYSQRNGGGLSYHKEFDNFKGFFRSLFRSKKKRNLAEKLRQEALRNEEKTRMLIQPEGEVIVETVGTDIL